MQEIDIGSGAKWDGSVSVKSGSTPAVVTADGELLTSVTEREINVMARYMVQGLSATAYVVLIDLSDTTNFPHTETGRIDITSLHINVDRANNTVGAIRIGVVTRVDATNGDVLFFEHVPFSNTSDTFIRVSENYAPSQLKTGVSGGVLQQIITSGGLTDSTAFQSDTALASPRGAATVSPAVGDIVVAFEYTSGGAYSAQVKAFYHAAAA